MGLGTSAVAGALYMLVLGIGLGCVMQVLVLLVQNAVPYSELGVATSGATFFRSIGGSFGTAIFGAIFSNVLVGNLVRHLGTSKLPAGVSSASVSPAILHKLPEAVHHGIAAAYAESIQTVFVIAAPIALIAFIASWLIPQLELRKAISTSSRGTTGASGSASGSGEREQIGPAAPPREPLAPAVQRTSPTELA